MKAPAPLSSKSLVLAGFVVVSATLGSAVSTAGCGGNGGSGGAGGAVDPATVCFDYSKFDGTSPAASFKADVLPIFQRSCGLSTSCHGDPNSSKKEQPYLGPNKNTPATDADITQILAGIVGKASVEDPDMSVVTAGDPEHSFLMYKLDGQVRCEKLSCAATDDCGVLMPSGSSDTLAENERDGIRRWIAQGAKNN